MLPLSDSATHYGFSDESHQNIGRFRGIGLVTSTISKFEEARPAIGAVLSAFGVREFKWHDLRTKRNLALAKRLVDQILKLVANCSFRIDVLIWDTYDSRHNIRGRDDKANLQRMYFHLVKTVLDKRWPNECEWVLFPDENNIIDWEAVKLFLEYKRKRVEVRNDLTTKNNPTLEFLESFRIHDILQRQSHHEPIIQMADFFIGLGIFSYAKFDAYEQWLRTDDAANDMFGYEDMYTGKLSNSDNVRSELLKYFDDACKMRHLGVSLKTNRGLQTIPVNNPLSYWAWCPQHEMDKAPIRTGE